MKKKITFYWTNQNTSTSWPNSCQLWTKCLFQWTNQKASNCWLTVANMKKCSVIRPTKMISPKLQKCCQSASWEKKKKDWLLWPTLQFWDSKLMWLDYEINLNEFYFAWMIGFTKVWDLGQFGKLRPNFRTKLIIPVLYFYESKLM